MRYYSDVDTERNGEAHGTDPQTSSLPRRRHGI